MALPLADMQGHVYPGFKKPFQTYLFVQFISQNQAANQPLINAPDNPGFFLTPPGDIRAWVQTIIPLVSSAVDVQNDIAQFRNQRGGQNAAPARLLNVAFSHTGLIRLGVAAADLVQLPADFKRTPAQRAAVVSDDPTQTPLWTVGGSASTEPDAVLILAADSALDMTTYLGEQQALLTTFRLHRLDAFDGAVLADSKEHFGFTDNITQITPVIADVAGASEEDVLAGEFILGKPRYQHVDQDGNDVPDPPVLPWAKNGSYLVFRKLEQQVHEFRVATAVAVPTVQGKGLFPIPAGAPGTDMVQAKCVGRWKDGTPLNSAPGGAPGVTPDPLPAITAADYQADAFGFKTPHFAHIRKAHPRDLSMTRAGVTVNLARNHRLLRRGIAYGPPLPPDAADNGPETRGVLFTAYQADIAEQFEFIMRGWANNDNVSTRPAGVAITAGSPGQDALIGVNTAGLGTGDRRDLFPDQVVPSGSGPHISETPVDFQRFVVPRGSGYFLSPGKKGLTALSN